MSDGRNASATAIRIAARPALNRKNLTPASRDTTTSVAMIPTPRCARNRKRTEDNDMRGRLYWAEGAGGTGEGGGGGGGGAGKEGGRGGQAADKRSLK